MGEYLNWSYEIYWVRKKTRELEVCLIDTMKTKLYIYKKINNMKKISYYNTNDVETELEIFINSKEEITFSLDDGGSPATSISLPIEDVEELIIDLQKLLKEI
jgi:hypothetical protein